MKNEPISVPLSAKICVARLLFGFSNSSNDGIRPKAPQAVSNSSKNNVIVGVRTIPHAHLMIFCFFVALPFLVEPLSDVVLRRIANFLFAIKLVCVRTGVQSPP